MPGYYHPDPARFTSNLVASFKSHSISETWFSQLQMALLWGGGWSHEFVLEIWNDVENANY